MQRKNIWIMNHYSIGHLAENGGRHLWIAEGLKRDGYNPVVFGCNEKHNSIGSYYPSNDLWQEIASPSGIKFVPIKSTQYMGNGKSRVKNMLVFAINLIKVAKDYAKKYGKPDIIYASSVHPLTVLAGEHIAKVFNVPCIGEARDLWPEGLVAYGSIKKDSMPAKLLYMGEKYMYKRADAMIFTMEGGKAYICEHKWDTNHGGPINLDNIYYVCNGIDIKQFDENANNYFLPDVDLDNSNIICGVYTGAIKRANNLGILLEGVKALKSVDNLKFLIWGEGNEIDELKKKAQTYGLQDVFVFKGNVEKKYIASIVKRSDFNILHWEKSSINNYGYSYNKVFDYLAAGKPILSTIENEHGILRKEKCCIETRDATPTSIAEGIERIVSLNDKEKEQLGLRVREVAYKYDFNEHVKQIEKIICSL